MRIEIERLKKFVGSYALYEMRVINEIKRKEYRFLFVGPTTNYNDSSLCKKYIEKHKQEFFCLCKEEKIDKYITIKKYRFTSVDINELLIGYKYDVTQNWIEDNDEEVLYDFERIFNGIDLKEVKIIEIRENKQ